MRSLTSFLFTLLTYTSVLAQSGMLFNKEYVDLKGKDAITVFVNNTNEFINLGYTYFNQLPYVETRDTLKLAPGMKDSIRLVFSFPDFISINDRIKIYNSPGGRQVCTITKYADKSIYINFDGPLAQENAYYLAYWKFLGNYDKESRSYYTTSSNLTDWNKFPAIADSITNVRSNFLANYKGELPEWFKKHEHTRLFYNQYFRMLNALHTKEFYSGKKIDVDQQYYAFEKNLNKNDNMLLTDTYLSAMEEYLTHQAHINHKSGTDGEFFAIDSLYHQTDIGDVMLMKTLGIYYRLDKAGYDKIIPDIKFKQPERKLWIDSLVQTKLGTPYVGKKAPVMALTNSDGQSVSLADFQGKMVILNFWAVWCGPCIAEFSIENQLYNKYKDKGVVIINVCFDSDKESWLSVSKNHNLQMVNLYTNHADYNKLLRQYNLTAPPRSVLLNRQGIVVDNYLKRASMLTEKDLERILSIK